MADKTQITFAPVTLGKEEEKELITTGSQLCQQMTCSRNLLRNMMLWSIALELMCGKYGEKFSGESKKESKGHGIDILSREINRDKKSVCS